MRLLILQPTVPVTPPKVSRTTATTQAACYKALIGLIKC